MARVRDVLDELGLAPSKSRGQNFLKDENQIGRIVGAVLKGANGAPRLLEIGPGLGALTRPLLGGGAEIKAVEFDRGLAENLRENLAAQFPGQLTVLHRDILTVTEDDLAPEAPFYLFGNLPYNISSPVLFWFLNHRRFFTGAAFMLQKEMAQRLTANPGGKDYGRLTVALGLWCEVKTILDVPPSAFHPRPKVESTVIALKPKAESELPPISPEAVGRLTAAAFAARRKTILNNLSRAYGRAKAEEALAAAGIEPGLRAETLSPMVLADLALKLEHKPQ